MLTQFDEPLPSLFFTSISNLYRTVVGENSWPFVHHGKDYDDDWATTINAK